MHCSYRLIVGVLFVDSVIGMTFALYLEHVQGLAPCPLCVFQRVGLIALGLVSLIAFVHNPKSNVVKRIYALLGSIGILWSVGVAARHVWLQNLPPDQVQSCGPGLDDLVDALPVWSLLFFSVLALISLWQLLRNYPFVASTTFGKVKKK